MTDEKDRAAKWIAGRDTGLSSKAIWATMMGVKGEREYPSDPSDIGRCFRLLEAMPEWKARLGEMRAVSPYWAALVERWQEIRDSMDREVGIDWSKGEKAPKTHKLMKSILEPIEDKDPRVVRFNGGTMRFGV